MATVSLQTAFDDARRAIETGAADKAIGIAQHILTHFPRMIEGSRLLGEAYLNAGQPEQAAAAFGQVLAADPENVAAYYGRGLAQQSLDQRTAAITSFERALEIQPNLADLRTQLMRLYAETPGSAGQFRLSRAGLGRLYARGGMFSQAVDEFRAVLDNEPDRDDAQVALAEALWRDGQEDEAMEYCRDVLEQRPDLIKPTVLLAYMQVAGGQPEGETLWRRAAEQDATMALARTLFDILPPIRIEEPVLPEFDEAEWRAQSARRAAQTQALPVAPAAAEADDDIFADSWLSTAGTAAAASGAGAAAHVAQSYESYETPAAQAVGGSDDDLLASLLGFADDEPAAPVADAQPELDADSGVQPFSFDDWDTPTSAQPTSPTLPDSLSDLALDDEPTAQQPGADLGGVQPFSLDDWNLDEDAPAAAAPATSETPSADAGFGDVQPFSFDDDAGAEPAVEPFSLNAESGDLGGVQPFSFDDEPDIAPFSFEDDAPAATAPAADTGAADSGLGAVQPFSLDDWGLEDDNAAPGSAQPFGAQGQAAAGDDLGDLKPFSLDELSLDALDSGAPSSLSGPSMAEPEETAPETTGFNWQEPSWRAQMRPTAQPSQSQSDESIFSKLLRNRQPEAGAGDVPPAESVGDDNFFSLDDEPLRLDIDEIDDNASTADFADPAPSAAESAFAEPAAAPESFGAEAPAAPQPEEPVAPFSLDELTSSDDAFSWETPTAEQPAAEQPAATAQSDEELVPFSLADLGLTDDEIAALDEQPELAADTAADADTTPFSLADLGLTDDEIAALDLGDDQPAASVDTFGAADVPDTTAADADTAPFSLADLGLTDDELDLLNPSDTAGAAPSDAGQDAELADIFASLDQPAAAQDELADEGAELAPTMPALDEDAPAIAFDAEQDADAAGESADPFAAWGLGNDQPELSANQGGALAETDPFAAWDLGGDQPDVTPAAETTQAEPSPFAAWDLGADQPDVTPAAEAQAEPSPFAAWDLGGGQPALDAEPAAESAEGQGEEWVDLRSQLDVDAPATRTPDDFLAEAQETDGDVQSVLETMPDETDTGAEAMPFSLADLGLTDDEVALFGQTEADSFATDDSSAADTAFARSDATDAVDEQPVDGDAFPAFGSEEIAPADAVAYGGESPDADAGDATDLTLPSGVEAGDTSAEASAESAYGADESTPNAQFADAGEAFAAEGQPAFETGEATPSMDAPTTTDAAPYSADEPSVDTGEAFAAEGQPAFEAEATAPEAASAEPVANTPESAGAPDGGPAGTVSEAAPSAAVAAPAAAAGAGVAAAAGGDRMSAFRAQLAANPGNDSLRLAVARMSQGMNDLGGAVEQYKALIKRGSLLDDVVEDIQDSIADNDDPQVLRRLHRLLGDAYMKQNRLTEAMDEYSWTSTRSA